LSIIDPFGLIPLNQGGFSLYHIIDTTTGDPVYVGITNDFDRREQEHRRTGHADDRYVPEVQEKNLTYAQARGYEQADIAHFQTRDTSYIGEPIRAGDPNRCWSYALDRTDKRATAFRKHEKARSKQLGKGGC
jgi:hypothetical protein